MDINNLIIQFGKNPTSTPNNGFWTGTYPIAFKTSCLMGIGGRWDSTGNYDVNVSSTLTTFTVINHTATADWAYLTYIFIGY